MRQIFLILIIALIPLTGCQTMHHVPQDRAALPPLGPQVLYVDQSLSDNDLLPYHYSSLHRAIEAAPAGTERHPTQIYLAPDVYQLNGTQTQQGLIVDKPWISLVGLTSDPRDTVLADNRGHMIGAQGNTGSSPAESILVMATGFSARNLTIGNYCNVDLVYPRNPTLNQARRSNTITQAYAIGAYHPEQELDKFTFDNVHFISMLDTLALGAVKRVYFHQVYVQGTDDFIGGGQMHVFERSTIRSYSSKPIYQAGDQGTAFLDVDWLLELDQSPTLYLTKSPSRLFLADVRFKDVSGGVQNIVLAATPKPETPSFFTQIQWNGEPFGFDASQPAVRVPKARWQDYSAANLLAGEDNWNPTSQAKTALVEPLAIALRGSSTQLQAGQQGISVQALFFPAIESQINWHIDQPNTHWKAISSDSIEIVSDYSGEHAKSIALSATLLSGLVARYPITLLPSVLPAPDYVQWPQLIFDQQGGVAVAYQLDLQSDAGKREDWSHIRWYRMLPNGKKYLIAENHTRQPAWQYRLQQADIGHHIGVEIQPRHARSDYGPPVFIRSDKPVSMLAFAKQQAPLQWQLRSEQFPLLRETRLLPYGWTQDTFYPQDQYVNWSVSDEVPWRFGEGINGATQAGLMPATQGARLLFSREDPASAMDLVIKIDPEKTAGQGFGSPNGQYLEIYIDYDTQQQTGYALRIERTKKYAFATDMTLYAYQQGQGTALTDSVSTSAFNATTTVRLSRHGDRLTALVTSSTEPSNQQKAAGLVHQVELAAQVTPTCCSGFGLQHTGTVSPGGRFVVREFNVQWQP